MGLVAQVGIAAFLEWYSTSGGQPRRGAPGRPDVFGTAPRELTRSVSLQQALQLLRTVVDTVEAEVAGARAAGRRAADPGGGAALLPGGGLRGRADLRPRRRGPGRVGRPARGPRGRRPRARRGRRHAPLAGGGARLGRLRPRHRRRRATPPGHGRGGRRHRAPGGRQAAPTRSSASRATGWSSSSATVGSAHRRRDSPSGSGRGPVVTGPVVADPVPRPAARPGPRWPASSPPGPGPVRRGRSRPTTCCPSACSTGDVVARRALVDRVYRRSRTPIRHCSTPSPPTSSTVGSWRPPPGSSSSTPTPSATG